MNKDARSHRRIAKRRSTGRRYYALVVMAVLLSVGAGLVGMRTYAPKQWYAMMAYALPVEKWYGNQQAALTHRFSHIKQVAEARLDPHPEIHFQFYHTLPGMPVSKPERSPEMVKPVLTTAQVASSESVMVSSPEVKELPAPAPSPVQKAVMRIFDPEKIQQTFGQELSKQLYIVQMGTFKKSKSAERLRLTLLAQGVPVQSIKTDIHGEVWYRVQVGPYTNREQAKHAQLQLQAKQLSGLLKPLN